MPRGWRFWMKFWWVYEPSELQHFPSFISTSSSRNKGIYWVYFQLQTAFISATCTDTSCWNKAALQGLKLPEGLHSKSGEKLDVPDIGSDHPKLRYGAFSWLIHLSFGWSSKNLLLHLLFDGAQMVFAALLLLNLARWTNLVFSMTVIFHNLLSLQPKMKV